MSDRVALKAGRRAVVAGALLALAGVMVVPAMAQDAAKKNLLIGATAGSNYDLLQEGIVPQLKAQGYTFLTVSELMAKDSRFPKDVVEGTVSMPKDAVLPEK